MSPKITLVVSRIVALSALALLPISAIGQSVHRIGVRVVDGTGELYDRTTGKTFVPRGNVLIHLGPEDLYGKTIVWHDSFNVGIYDHQENSAKLAAMQASGYNTVKVYLSAVADGNPAGGLSDPYFDNVADFLRLARAHNIYTILTQDFLPTTSEYSTLISASCCALFDGDQNQMYLTSGGLQAHQKFWPALIAALRARTVPLDVVLGYQIAEEFYFDGNHKPLTLTSGLVTTGNGKTYDMSSATAKQQMMDENFRFWLDNVRASILTVDPSALVIIGILDPEAAHPGDGRVINPMPAFASTIDVVSFDPYVNSGVPLAKLVQYYGLTAVNQKPVIMGEYGSAPNFSPSLTGVAEILQRWQIESCQYGFSGWLLWTWDTETQPDGVYWNANSGDGILNRALNPLTRPDPCKVGPYRGQNVALGSAAIASKTLPVSDPQMAIDGDFHTGWNSGGFPPQWIEVHLPHPTVLAGVRLSTQMSPLTGATTHNLYVQGPDGSFRLVHQFIGVTSDGDVLAWDSSPPLGGVTAVRVETVQSPSWVGWKEIETLSGSDLAIVSSANPAPLKTPIAFTVSVTGTMPTGTVAFSEGGMPLLGCSSVEVIGSGNTRLASCIANSMDAGQHTIAAIYSGDLANATSTTGIVQMVQSVGAAITSVAIEYHHATFDHYFFTSSADEVAKLDAGIFSGWSRTGESFPVYTSSPPGTAAVCRFFSTAFGEKSSHFYAPRGLGCEGTLTNGDWHLEGDVFFAPLPNSAGVCPQGAIPVYRLYNNGLGGAPNHRFTVSQTIRSQMLGLGYLAEGAGPGVGFCSPQ